MVIEIPGPFWKRLVLVGLALLLNGCAYLPTWLGGSEDARLDKGLPIAVSSQALAIIVIPSQPPPPVRFAAQELKSHLEAMTGAVFPIQEGTRPDSIAIMLGEALALEAEITLEDVPRDGYRIVTEGAYVYIAGRDDHTLKSQVLFLAADGPLPANATAAQRQHAYGDVAWDFERGTLHGVYDLLEQLGVRWFYPGQTGTVIPQRNTLRIAQQDRLAAPHFQLRLAGDIHVPGVDGFTSPGAEIYRELGWDGRAQRLWMVRQRASSQPLAYQARVKPHQWASRFAKTHADYFALQPAGYRLTDPANPHLNYTSGGMLNETMQDLAAYADGRPSIARGISPAPSTQAMGGWPPSATVGQTFSLTPAPDLQADHSPASLTLRNDDSPFTGRHSDYVWSFIQQVAREAAMRHPQLNLTCIARESYLEPPDAIDHLPDNVIIGLASEDVTGGLYRVTDKRRFKKVLKRVKDWSNYNERPLLLAWSWQYRESRPLYRGVPMLLPYRTGDLIRKTARHARYAHFTYDTDNPLFESLNRYLMYRLLWEPDQSVEELLQDYVSSLYGPAAPPVMKMLDDIQLHCQEIAREDADLQTIWEEHFSGTTLQRYRNWLIEASVLAADTPYQQAVDLLNRHLLGPMNAGQDAYLKTVKSTLNLHQERISVIYWQAGLTIDGRLSDAIWQQNNLSPFYDLLSGERVPGPSFAMFALDDKTFYCGLSTDQPAPSEVALLIGSSAASGPIHMLRVDAAGSLREGAYSTPTLPPDRQWSSGAWAAIYRDQTSRQTEIAIPRRALPALKNLDDRPARMVLVMTWLDSNKNPIRQVTTSPMIRGALLQPEAFNQLVSPKR